MTVLQAVPYGDEATYTALEEDTGNLAAQIRSRPESLGLMMSPEQERLAWLAPLLLTMLVPLLGVIKIGVGMSRNRPVSFLVLLVIGSLFLFVMVLRRRTSSTRAGDHFLKTSRKAMAALKATSETSSSGLTPGDVALAFALFGPAALTGSNLSRVRTWYTPPVTSSSSSSCSSSCGGSSCGGGCGGGGCGGCGS